MNTTTSLIDRAIVLVGLMGAGKSSIGRRLAAQLKIDFTDADAEIETAAGCSIADFFERHGEDAFRQGERRVIARLLERGPQVLATGGGAFIDPVTRKLLSDKAITIWLSAELDLLVKRCARRNTRPLLRAGDPREILGSLIEERYPIYRQADITVETDDGPHGETVDRILAALRHRAEEQTRHRSEEQTRHRAEPQAP